MMHLCNPALLYFVLAVLSIFWLIVNRANSVYVFGKIVGVLLWTWFLNFVCNKGFTNVSWALVAAPYIIILIAVVTGVVNMSDLQTVVKKEDDKKEPLVLI
jgi:hypothetical protein